MNQPQEITVSEFRTELPRLLNRVMILNESFLITSHGRPLAILRPESGEGDQPKTEVSITPDLATC
jgi:antitoxin (DNA-binding transcriptional repressor) of toxin-antitoxin stability system